jgi:hypothetical protein
MGKISLAKPEGDHGELKENCPQLSQGNEKEEELEEVG